MSVKGAAKKVLMGFFGFQFMRGLISRTLFGHIPIFLFHRVDDPDIGSSGHSMELLRQMLTRLKQEGYTFISLDDAYDMVAGKIPYKRKSVVFTMDDGYLDQATVAAPLFIEFECPVTIFIVTGFLDGTHWPWDAKVKHVFTNTKQASLRLEVDGQEYSYDISDENKRMEALRKYRRMLKNYSADVIEESLRQLSEEADVIIPQTPPYEHSPMTWDHARELEESGIRFGSHTHRHYIVSHLSAETVRSELSNSWSRISTELKNPSRIFAYPNGTKKDFGYKDITLLQECGYAGAVTTVWGYFDVDDRSNNPFMYYEIKRLGLPENMDDFVQCYTGFERLKDIIIKLSPGAFIESRFGGKKQLLRYYYYKFLYQFGSKGYQSVNWDKVKRLVFICRGNICRSPYAEMYARKYGIDSISAGLDTTNGKSANDTAIRVAYHRGIDLQPHVVQEMDSVDIQPGDLIIGMEPEHLEQLKDFSQDDVQATLLGLWGEKKRPYLADPYGRSEDYFNRCFSEIESSVKAVLDRLDIQTSDQVKKYSTM